MDGVVMWMVRYACLTSCLVCAFYDSDLESLKGPHDYCAAEEFRTVCSSGEVAVMVAAMYGRMTVGRCVKTDYGYVGCYANVRDILDEVCSGRRQCAIRIPDQQLDNVKTCPAEFKTYLNATYKCVQVEKAACQSCHGWRQARVTSPRGYLASVVSSEETATSSCGTSTCPWVIEAKTGQRINITLLDFGQTTSSSAAGQQQQGVLGKTCLRYAVIKERSASKDTPVCGLQGQREYNVYLSTGSVVEIHVVSTQVFDKRGQFMLYYEVIGCEDMVPANKHTIIRREDNNLTVSCAGGAADKVWHLRCVGSTWQGQVGTCSEGASQTGHRVDDSSAAFPMAILITVVVSIALVIGVCILTIGFVYLKRRHAAQQAAQMERLYYGRHVSYDPPLQDYMPVMTVDQQRKYVTYPRPNAKQAKGGGGGGGGGGQGARDNVYLRRMDSRPLPPIPDMSEHETCSEESRSVAVGLDRMPPGGPGVAVASRGGAALPPHHQGFMRGAPDMMLGQHPQQQQLQLRQPPPPSLNFPMMLQQPVGDQSMYNQSLTSNTASMPSSLNSPTGAGPMLSGESREGLDYFYVDSPGVQPGLPLGVGGGGGGAAGMGGLQGARPMTGGMSLGPAADFPPPPRLAMPPYARQPPDAAGGFTSHDIPLRPTRDGAPLSNSDHSSLS